MEFFDTYLNLNYVSWGEAILRIGLACLFGLVFGLERHTKNKPINFRVYMLVSMTSCVICILGLELGQELLEQDSVTNLDLGKIISGTLTGIGFLGAGAIMKLDDNRVIGTATGASIWASGGIGLTLGFGYYGLAFAAFVTVALILFIGGFFMKHSKNLQNDLVDKDDL